MVHDRHLLVATPAQATAWIERGRTGTGKVGDQYGVEARRSIEQVKRNKDRFPSDFMF